MTTELVDIDPVLIAKCFERLGVLAEAPADLASLEALYLAWCRTIPFDNMRKRIFMANGAVGPVPGATASRFLQDFIDSGTGGTCWSTSSGLNALLRAAGFRSWPVLSSMHTDADTWPNHCSVVVAIGDRRFLVDSSMLFEHPLPLDHCPTEQDAGGLHPVRAEPIGDDRWTVWWKAGHFRESAVGCDIDITPAEAAQITLYHDRTRANSLFNHQLFIRRNRAGRIESYGRQKLIIVEAGREPTITAISGSELPELLVSRFEISAEVVAQLPLDSPNSHGFV